MAHRASKTEELIAARLARAKRRRRRALLCLPLLALLAVGAVVAQSRTLAQELAVRSRAAVAAAGYEGVEVVFEGREAHVRGQVADPVDRLAVEALIEGQRGVRWADLSGLQVQPKAPAEVTVATATPASQAPASQAPATPTTQTPIAKAPPSQATASVAPSSATPSSAAPSSVAPASVAVPASAAPASKADPQAIRLSSTPDGLVLRGVLPSEARQAALRTAVIEALRDAPWTDETTVAPDADDAPDAAWLEGVVEVIPRLEVVERLQFSIDPHVLAVSGQLSAPQARARLEAALQSAAPRHVVHNRIELITPAEHLALCMQATAGMDLFFGPDGVHLTEDGLAELRRLTPILQRSTGPIRVEAHTDTVGEAGVNRGRSVTRAEAIKAFLVEQGIAADRIQARGFGESKPIADNATPAGRAANRRVLIELAE